MKSEQMEKLLFNLKDFERKTVKTRGAEERASDLRVSAFNKPASDSSEPLNLKV